MDEFDLEFADELEAMEDFCPPEKLSPKPKRTLNFSTPKRKDPVGRTTGAEDSLDLLQSPREPLTGSQLMSRLNREPSSPKFTQKVKKRQREENSLSESDLEYEDEDLMKPEAPISKRSKFDTEADEFENCEQPKRLHAPLHHKDHKIRGAAAEDVEDGPSSPDHHIMEKILQERNKHQTKETVVDLEAQRQHRIMEGYDFERARVHQRIPTGDYLATTGTEGERVYMKLRAELDLNKEFDSYGKTSKGTQLLGVSVTDLRDQLEEERRKALLEQSEMLSAAVHRQLAEEDQGFLDDEDVVEEGREIIQSSAAVDTPESRKLLWVEKYAPQRYTDLLSEESLNRNLLHWLKMWDYVVFNKELPIKNKDKKKEIQKNVKKKFQPEVSDELDKFKRPLQRVALLCGPPGLGKTTLAHIVARHAGYNVVEMNASDDRSVEVFKNKIEAATQMKAVMGDDPRPNCLVIDEIDGAPQPAINVLLNLVKKTDPTETSKKKKKDEGDVLRRPIICICNDQYVPALRQLRQCALILNFPETEPARLASRLHEVVRSERMKSDVNTLLALCEKTGNDIRSCLNTLQFIQRRCTELNLRAVQTLTVGQKDSHKSLFSVWHEILTLPRPKRQRFVNLQEQAGKSQVTNTSPAARFTNVLSEVQKTGEYEKLTQGLFENYLECKFKDPHMDGVVLANDWLCYTDHVNQYIQHVQDYRLMPYLPYISVVFHFLFASNVPTKIQYPRSFTESNMAKTKCQNLVMSMMTDMTPSVRNFINVPITVMEILPPLLQIMQPSFRPVNTQLYSSREKENLAQLIRVMIAYNMTYHQEKSLEGQYSYVLEPHMDEVVRFPGMKQHRQLTYSSKQLIAREVEVEKMRRSELAKNPIQEPVAGSVASVSMTTEQKSSVPNHLQKLNAKPLGKQPTEEVQMRDFFGRIIRKPTADSQSSTSVEPKKKNVLATDIWFHFQVGYSNAVRRNVRVKDFF